MSFSAYTMLVGWLRFNGPLRQYFSLYRPSPREREKEKRKDRRQKNVQTTPLAPTANAAGPCPTIKPNQ